MHAHEVKFTPTPTEVRWVCLTSWCGETGRGDDMEAAQESARRHLV